MRRWIKQQVSYKQTNKLENTNIHNFWQLSRYLKWAPDRTWNSLCGPIDFHFPIPLPKSTTFIWTAKKILQRSLDDTWAEKIINLHVFEHGRMLALRKDKAAIGCIERKVYSMLELTMEWVKHFSIALWIALAESFTTYKKNSSKKVNVLGGVYE